VNDLTPGEVGIIKGLLRRGRHTQQQIVAFFTHPRRTIHANLIGHIKDGSAFANIPPADAQACERYIQAWYSNRGVACVAGGALSPRAPLGPFQFSFAYTFHPVGQGLFTSGWFTRAHKRPFRWVYDCGTSNSQALLTSAMDGLQSESVGTRNGRAKIDLVAISHFDADHVSGLLALLNRFDIGILLLPYLTPWQRLKIALREDASARSDLLACLIAPTAFLLSRDGEGSIDRILLVPSGEGPAAPPPELPLDVDPEPFDDDGPLPPPLYKSHEPQLEPEDGEGGDFDPAAVGMGGDEGLAHPTVRILPPGATITIGRYWEFVPYNDGNRAPNDPPAFVQDATAAAQRLRTGKSHKVREAALRDLKKIYKKHFGGTSEDKNIISLFLYSGPIGPVSLIAHSEWGQPPDEGGSTPPSPWRGWPDRFGQLFTGDGYLDDPVRLQAFIQFYGPSRIERGGCFQVMHHGSRHNWFKGVAQAISPQFSLFSSNPGRKVWHHPDQVVVDDFSGFCPRQIDKKHAWRFAGVFVA